MTFERFKTIRFQHCDPAGIIFYPQYFVLFHEVIEDWFTEGLATPYGDYIRIQRLGVPAVKATDAFMTQAFLGERLRCNLSCTRLGSSSLEYQVDAWHGEELRARGHATVVQMSLDSRRSVPFAPALRARIGQFLTAEKSTSIE
ncbi:MAG: acyl-CoA thioesterase [Gammaproteobacteria bacterium]|nr:acyl-CoA thioesterase [Gammaproteobacteria bacterium]